MEDLDSGRLSKETGHGLRRRRGDGRFPGLFEGGEQLSAGELIKCIAVVSGNDAAVAMAEHLPAARPPSWSG